MHHNSVTPSLIHTDPVTQHEAIISPLGGIHPLFRIRPCSRTEIHAAANEMTSPIHAQLFNTDGKRLSNIKTLSHKSFAGNLWQHLSFFLAMRKLRLNNIKLPMDTLINGGVDTIFQHLLSPTSEKLNLGNENITESINVIKDILTNSQKFLEKIKSNPLDKSLLSPKDHYRALTNYWAFMLLAFCNDQPMDPTPELYAYSLLYPYTDNIMDDASVSPEEKQQFIELITNTLHSKDNNAAPPMDLKIRRVLALIDNLIDTPSIKLSLYAVHQAQIESLLQQKSTLSASKLFGITMAKGAAAVLPNSYLTQHALPTDQLQFAILLGELGQLLNDIEGITEDTNESIQTPANRHYQQHGSLNKFVIDILRTVERAKRQLPSNGTFNQNRAITVLNLYISRLLVAISSLSQEEKPSVSPRFLRHLSRWLPVPIETLSLIYQIEKRFFIRQSSSIDDVLVSNSIRDVVNSLNA